MSLVIRAWPGYDDRDNPKGTRGANGLTLTFVALEPGAYACNLEVLTGWMARPLATEMMRHGREQVRRATPGVDAGYHRGITAAVHLCVPRDATDVPDYFVVGRGNEGDCPHLGVPCKGSVGYLVADEALRTLIEQGEDALEAWLRETAAEWMNPAEEVAP